MQLIHRAAKRKIKYVSWKHDESGKMFILIHHPSPKSLISQICRLERSLTFEIVSLPLDNLDTQHPLCLFFFFFLNVPNVNLQYFSLSLSLVKIESRCCRIIFTYPGTESYVMMRRLIGNFNVAERLKLKFVQLLARWKKNFIYTVLRIAEYFAIFKNRYIKYLFFFWNTDFRT